MFRVGIYKKVKPKIPFFSINWGIQARSARCEARKTRLKQKKKKMVFARFANRFAVQTSRFSHPRLLRFTQTVVTSQSDTQKSRDDTLSSALKPRQVRENK